MSSGGCFDLDATHTKIVELEDQSNAVDFWQDSNKAKPVMTQLNTYRMCYNAWADLKYNVEENVTMLQLLQENEDTELMLSQEFKNVALQCSILEKEYQSLKIKALLSEPYDMNDAFIHIQTGAGGTESCDWVQILLRLYTRWCERKDYGIHILYMQESEGGIKSVSLQVKGSFAYGYLLSEAGVHRLVRISPFDSNKRRHTTFASVYVSPVVEDDINLEIKPDDIRVDTYRSSGAGGQHVNTTDSAVRITHLETGIVVQCQNERSQIKNRQTAMKVLLSRLFTYYETQQKNEQEETAIEKKDIAWGSQIRSYIFHPYTLVKDHRTGVETRNIQPIINGEIDIFIEQFLQERANENNL